MGKFLDAHLHVTPTLLPYLTGVPCIANADSPEEYHWLHANSSPEMTISVGIHPWKAATTCWDEMEPLLTSCSVIGEIGLDRAWCNTPMHIQEEVFHHQLILAHTQNKPVILHTKGMEQEILHTIQQYPNRYLIHWYSTSEFIEEFIALDCWFTIGPDLSTNTAVTQLAKILPLHKLLPESDGLSGISWAHNQAYLPSQYPRKMEQHIQNIALLRGISPDFLINQCTENLKSFLNLQKAPE